VSIAIADFIVGPIGIVLANAMMGEISPAIAEAILSARGKKLLLPLVQSHVVFVGLAQKNLGELIAEAVESLVKASKAGD
jgi:Mg2+/citrate symporter